MKEIRIPAARFIFNKQIRFDPSIFDVYDIRDDDIYYSRFQFISNVAYSIYSRGRLTSASYASHLKGASTDSLGTTCELISYDTKTIYILFIFLIILAWIAGIYGESYFKQSHKSTGSTYKSWSRFYTRRKESTLHIQSS